MRIGIFIRKVAPKKNLMETARYGKPINRWKHYYANEDGVFEENFNYIEQMTIPQPFPAHHPIFSHKGLPTDLFPPHMNDVRYDFKPHYWPRRHHVPDHKFKLYNWSSWDEMLHGNGFPDFDLDYQLADPMESNHYVQNRSIAFNFFMMGFLFVFVVIYPIWGYGIFDVMQDPILLRKQFFDPQAGLAFARVDYAVGDNLGLPIKNQKMFGIDTDSDGNPLPRAIKRYSFADEYTYRI